MIRPYRGHFPVVDASAYIDMSAQVIGDVVVGAESSVWMNVVVRGDVHRIRIGDRTNVQDNSVVHAMKDTHPTLIGSDVTIGHSAVIHGCTIADRVLVGIGAIVLNGAVIGEQSIIGAGALVTERFVVPPRSLVLGRPGRVVRELTDDEARSIQDYADRYVRYRLDYMAPVGS